MNDRMVKYNRHDIESGHDFQEQEGTTMQAERTQLYADLRQLVFHAGEQFPQPTATPDR